MPRTIHKFQLDHPHSIVPALSGATPLHVGEQRGKIMVWMSVPVQMVGEVPPIEMHDYVFHVVPTGGLVEERWTYIGTVHLPFTGLIFHIYQG